MANFVNMPKPHKNKTAEIMRLRQMVTNLREQADAIDATLAAMLPADEASATYQRQRAICRDRGLMREFLEGRL